jgi:hypothetical protein
MRPRLSFAIPRTGPGRTLALAVAACVLASPLVPAFASTGLGQAVSDAVRGASEERTVRAGVGVADATWNVGAAAGQYSAPNTSLFQNLGNGEVDPHAHSRIKEKSYGTHSRLTVRALVVEGTDGQRVALLKTDNYLAQDLLLRRVGQLLEEAGSGIAFDDILHSASHNHSSPYYTTTSPGVFVFQDVVDQRMFEYQARAIRDAILEGEAALRPARMAAHTVEHSAFKANVVGPATADDGTPAGYPREFGDLGVVVMRFDELVPTPGGPMRPGKPIGVFMNFGQHPESLDGHGLTTSDFLGPLERFVEREVGAPLVFTQGDVGSAEGPYEREETFQELPDGTMRAFAHSGFAQMERGARLLADAVVEGFEIAGTERAQVPWSSDFPVQRVSAWVPGPVSQPYPTVSNCRSEPTYSGNPGAPALGLPDCARPGSPTQANPVVDNLRLHGVPVPDHYSAPGYPAVQENNRLRLQVFRLGEVVLASCACEAQVDLILNLESRLNDVEGDMWLGYDWSGECAENEGGYLCRGRQVTRAAYDRMVAQVHNDARGWDDPEHAAEANSEPTDPAQIKGNFTHDELPAELGFRLPVGLGHAGDYNGYTVSYREYMSRDHYRKALTTYGPHTADYMNTRLVDMARSFKGGPEYAGEVHQVVSDADEARQEALARSIGAASGRAYDAWLASLPADLGPVEPLAQPGDVERFGAATFTWRGGSNAVDNPDARVERLVDGQWQPFADMSGEVQTLVEFPKGVQGVADTHTGRQEWRWTAAFEAFTGFPARFGSTPEGTYRFVVDGASRVSGDTEAYRLESDPFQVLPWGGLTATDVSVAEDGSVGFDVPVDYPRTYASPFRTVRDDGRQTICRTCSFRPWAATGEAISAVVTVTRADGSQEQVVAERVGGRWTAPTALRPGDRAELLPGALRDAGGNTNAAAVLLG